MPCEGVLAEPGAPAWFELHTRDYDTSVQFYKDVFGWDAKTMSDTPDFRYTTLGEGDNAGHLVGELLAGRRELADGLEVIGDALLELRDAGRGGLLGEAPRAEVVPHVAARDRDDVAPQTDLLDVLKEDDVHGYCETYGSRAISRARLTATAICS